MTSARSQDWRIQTGIAAAAVTLVIVGVAGWMYWHARIDAIRDLDQRLLAGAAGVRYVLAEDFHDRALAPGAISVPEDEGNIGRLSAFARRAGFKFLYTVIRKDGHLYLTSSSATEEELAARKEVRCFDAYDEAHHLRDGVFESTNAIFVSYADRWGTFRAALFPEVSPGGKTYVSGAEVDMACINALFRHHVVEAIGVALVLFLSSVPVFLVYIRRQRIHARVLKEANERLVQEMADRKLIEKELIRAHNMEALGTLAGGVAHDFNNILAAILAHAELAQEIVGPGSPAAGDMVEIRRAGDRAKDLIRQILAFARKTSSEVKLVQVDAVAQEVLGLIKSFLPSSIHLQARLESNGCVRADPVSIHQIFMNLCTNAIHAMAAAGGRLSVAVKDVMLGTDAGRSPRSLPPGRYVEITVADTGGGIAPDIIDSIFVPYFSTKGPGAGTGLGLAVVQSIVGGQGGEIHVESTPGQGAVFTVLLPALSGPAPSPQEPSRMAGTPGGTERILVVDDEPSVALTSARLLERLGYRVTTCTDSEEALSLFRANPGDFDLLITDMTMPGLTGDRLATAACSIKPDLPVILCTGYSRKLDAFIAGGLVTRLLNKPFTGSDLANMVRGALDGDQTAHVHT